MLAGVPAMQGKRLTFDEESRALFDAGAPTQTEADFEAVLKQLEARLPGDGTRSYVVNYNLGKDLIRAYLTRQSANGASVVKQWAEFAVLWSSPRLPSGLK